MSPGGEAPLVSSLLMAAVPARVAGVEQLVVCTPPAAAGPLAPVLAAGIQACGVDRVFTVAAMARVTGLVGVASLPGPTETLLIADESADPEVVAADLLAQAEHAADAWPILLTPSPTLAGQVQRAVGEQLPDLARRHIAATSLGERGAIVLTSDVDQAIEPANRFAPEHLCLLLKDPWLYVERIRNAGGIFVGEAACEALGDYIAGPSTSCPPAVRPGGRHRSRYATSCG